MKHQWIIEAPFYIRKPHKCPRCAGLLRVDRREQNRVHWKEFFCTSCERYYTIREIKRHEGLCQ